MGGTKITCFKEDVEQKNDLRINYSNEQHLSSLTFYPNLLQAAMALLHSSLWQSKRLGEYENSHLKLMLSRSFTALVFQLKSPVA